ncbi:MAG: bifunctional methylenetetrahydrofolate dehydrogenase/methenyltetrahydrofolate [Candidatus Improbicoccus devescovinae]|nr:MAG: bifunctional methylenetetrahydrofolate dehydrogenase/methenyltetrahydrofolate [Candidatus Improbicoccus devescovinae]
MIVNGIEIAQKINYNTQIKLREIKKRTGKVPCLAVIIIGENIASRIYVKNKIKTCENLGIISKKFEYPADVSQSEILNLIYKLNNNKNITGILVQLPLPENLNEFEIVSKISPEKDVDVFNPINLGKVFLGNFDILPCTASGILCIINELGIQIKSKNCVIIGRSNIVGKPIALGLLHKDATVTICHSYTNNLCDICTKADILISACGQRNLVTANMIKPGATVIDVGITRHENKICGDVDFENVVNIAENITPVPGGVGPLTVAYLMKNTLILFEKNKF